MRDIKFRVEEVILKEMQLKCDFTNDKQDSAIVLILAQAIREHYKSIVPEEKETPKGLFGNALSKIVGFNQCREQMLKRIGE